MADVFQRNAFQNNAFGISEGLYLSATEAKDVAAVVAGVQGTPLVMAAVEAPDGALIDTFTVNVLTLGEPGSLDPAATSTRQVLSNNNRTATYVGPGSWGTSRATQGRSTGKWYFEAQQDYRGILINSTIGIAAASHPLDDFYLGHDDTPDWSLGYRPNGLVYVTDPGRSTRTAIDSLKPYADQWVGLAFDGDLGKVWVRNHTGWDGDPVAGTGGFDITYFTSNRTFYPAVGTDEVGDRVNVNCGSTPFAYLTPAGFSAWAAPAVEAQDVSAIAVAVITHVLTLASTEAKDTLAIAAVVHTAVEGGIILAAQEAKDAAAFGAYFDFTNDLALIVFKDPLDTASFGSYVDNTWAFQLYEQPDVADILLVNVSDDFILNVTEAPDVVDFNLGVPPLFELVATEAPDVFGYAQSAFQQNAFQQFAFWGVNIIVNNPAVLTATEGFVDEAEFYGELISEIVLDTVGVYDITTFEMELSDTFALAAVGVTDRAAMTVQLSAELEFDIIENQDVATEFVLDSIWNLSFETFDVPDTGAFVTEILNDLQLVATEDLLDVAAFEMERMLDLRLVAVENKDVASLWYKDPDDEIVCVHAENRHHIVRYEQRESLVAADVKRLIPQERRRSDTYNRRRAC